MIFVPLFMPFVIDNRVDWTCVCQDCWQFPNRCDHVAYVARVLWLQEVM